MTHHGLDPVEHLLAERACERLIVEFVRRLDLGVPGSVAELFTSDGVWAWSEDGRRVEGRDALWEYFGSRPVDRLSRRMSTSYTGGMVAPRLPANVGHYEDSFRKVEGEWLLASRVLVLAFGGPTERLNSR